MKRLDFDLLLVRDEELLRVYCAAVLSCSYGRQTGNCLFGRKITSRQYPSRLSL